MEDSSFRTCEAQMVWDAGIIKRAVEYLNSPRPQMVILRKAAP